MYLVKTNYKEENVIQNLSEVLKNIIKENTIIVCIGTDRAIGDALGPLVGTMLKNSDFKYPVYGTLDKPIHALNIFESLEHIKNKHPKGNFLAIDACLGKVDRIGYITIGNGPLKPGAGVNKNLPAVGNIHITGIVNLAGYMEYMVLQNTRLSLVMKMADTLVSSIKYSLWKLNQQRLFMEN